MKRTGSGLIKASLFHTEFNVSRRKDSISRCLQFFVRYGVPAAFFNFAHKIVLVRHVNMTGFKAHLLAVDIFVENTNSTRNYC